MASFALPAKTFNYLRRLLLNYEHSGPPKLANILKHGRVAVDPDTDRVSSYVGDDIGHDVIVYLPPEIIAPISMSDQGKLTERLKDDLAECAKGVRNEYINAVRFELAEGDDFLFESAQPLSGTPPPDPDALPFWKPKHIRLFVSHRDNYKKQAAALANALESYGISSFVAHDTIQPMESWQYEIEKALETMEVFLALITDHFHESIWTNQEVGFAKARHTPIISLKLGPDPQGFIADKQALKGDVDKPQRSAQDIFRILADKLKQRDRLQTSMITSFCESNDWGDVRTRFDRMNSSVERLSDTELEQIRTAYAAKPLLYRAFYLHNDNRLLQFLQRTTGTGFEIRGNAIELPKVKENDEIPF